VKSHLFGHRRIKASVFPWFCTATRVSSLAYSLGWFRQIGFRMGQISPEHVISRKKVQKYVSRFKPISSVTSKTQTLGRSAGTIRHYIWAPASPMANLSCMHHSNGIDRTGYENRPIITDPPNGPVLFCSRASVVVVCRLSSSVTLPAGGPAGRRARGRSARRSPGAWAVDTALAGQYGYVPLGWHLAM